MILQTWPPRVRVCRFLDLALHKKRGFEDMGELLLATLSDGTGLSSSFHAAPPALRECARVALE